MRLRSLGILALFAVFLLPRAALAGGFTVTNTNDSGMGSLRQAITDANNSPGPDTTTFAIPGSRVNCALLQFAIANGIMPFCTVDPHCNPAGFVAAAREQSGGYSLARPAEAIVVGEVLAALGGRLYEPAFCETHGGGIDRLCTHLSGCSIQTVWQRLQEAVDGVLARLTVKDLLAPEGRSPWESSPSGATLPTLPQ